MHLDPLLDEPVAVTTKGWPASAGALPLKEVPGRRWRLLDQDLPLPVAVIRASALDHNSRWMRRFLDRFGVAIAPHGKTTMAPQLYARQLEDGAFAITVATIQQLLVCRRFGVPRVILANQVVGREAVRALAREAADPAFEAFCLVDSLDGVALLDAGLRAAGLGRPLPVLLEGGVAGGRTGVRTLEQGLAVARAVAEAPMLELAGIEGFEDVVKAPTLEAAEPLVDAFLAALVALAEACDREGLFRPGDVILTAGGSKWFDLVARRFKAAALERPLRIVLRSGCYLTHDSGGYADAFARLAQRTPEIAELGPGLVPALEVWAAVQSRPEPGLALVTMGKRDVAHDIGLPVPKAWFRPGAHPAPEALRPGHETIKLNDQHGFLGLPEASPLAVGDLVSFGISHPCTTFDKWQLLHVVDDDYRVLESIRTFF